jgi:serine/threonine protein kinase
MEVKSLEGSYSPKGDDFIGSLREVQLLKKGGFGAIYVDYKKSRVLKIVKTEGKKEEPNEIKILKKYKHVEGIIPLLYSKFNSNYYILVMDYDPTVVDLFDYITDNFIPNHAKIGIFAQCLKIVENLFDSGLAHGDVKDENFLVKKVNDSDIPKLTLIDFGSAYEFKSPTQKVQIFQGTAIYYPPEYFLTYEFEVEASIVWSLGLLLFTIHFRNIPYKTENEIPYTNLDSYFKTINLSSAHDIKIVDLIKQTLKFNPKHRIGLKDIKTHELFN